MKRVLRPTLAALALMTVFIGHARAQVLEQVPTDALMVLRVKNLQDVSNKIATLANQWGLTEMTPDLADPIAAFQKETKIQNGLNKDGDAAFAYLDPKGGNPDDSFLILIPVSDFAAFTGNFADAKTEGEITSFTIPNEGKTGYAAHWGNYAAVAPTKAILEAKPQGLKAEGLTAKELQDKDLILFSNVKQLAPQLLPKLEEARTEVATELDKEMSGNPKAQALAPAVKALVNQGLNVAKEYLQDAQAATLGVNLSAEGIATTVMTEFTAESYLGKTTQSFKNTDSTLLQGLPDTKYLFFGGAIADPAVMTRLFDDFLGPVIAELKADEHKALLDYVNAVREYTAAQSGPQTFGMIAPSGPIGAESLFQFVAVASGDPKALMEGYRKTFESQNALMKTMMSMSAVSTEPEADAPAADAEAAAAPAADPVKLTYTPAAKTIDGVAFDQFKTEFTFEGNTPEEAQAQQMLALIYGQEGLNGYLGAVDDKHVLFVSGGGDELMAQAVAAVKAGESRISQAEPVKQVAQKLPLNRIAAFYLPLGQWVETGVAYAQQFGMAVPFEVEKNLPPIGATVATEQNAIRIDSYIPSTLIESLISTGMQAYMGMQGGGQPGDAGSL
jgi:hypothetical protein